jgi:hypothetical protein
MNAETGLEYLEREAKLDEEKTKEHADYIEKETKIHDGFEELTDIQERLNAIKGDEGLVKKFKPRLDHADIFVRDALDAYGQNELVNPQVYEVFSEKLTNARTYLEMIEAANERIKDEQTAPQEPAGPEPATEPVLDEKAAKMKAEAEKGIAELEKVLDNYDKDDKRANMPRGNLSVAKEAYEKGDYEDAVGKAFMGLGMVDKRKKKTKKPEEKAKEETHDDLDETIKEIDDEAAQKKGKKKR